MRAKNRCRINWPYHIILALIIVYYGAIFVGYCSIGERIRL